MLELSRPPTLRTGMLAEEALWGCHGVLSVMHGENQAKELDLLRLKEKVDAGADFIITQFFYDLPQFFSFYEVGFTLCVSSCLVPIAWLCCDCCQRARAMGISCPILPGYMIIQTYAGFTKFTKWCKTSVPKEVSRNVAADN